MKKNILMVLTALICSVSLTSCDIEIDNDSSDTEIYASKLANTRWQLAEILKQEPNLCSGFDIK